MASADFTIKAGDTQPILTDTLKLSDGTVPNFAGSAVALVMRGAGSTAPATLTGVASWVNVASGAVQFAFTAADSATSSGDFEANWVVTGGQIGRMTFPTVGYLTITIEQSLSTAPQQLVTVADAKEYLSIPATDRGQDAKLTRFIDSLRPVVEGICGPVIPQIFEEWHDGGASWIKLRHAPRTGYGTSPRLTVLACSEYMGPIEWPLALVATPDRSQLYSVMLDVRLGRVVRRSAGGGVQPFPYGPQAVHVIYEAGQNAVPPNVYEGTLELVRVNYQRTQQATRAPGPYPARDDEADFESGQPIGFLVPGRVRELLAPSRRYPSLA